VTYKNAGLSGVYSQIKLDSGERVMISIAASEIKIFRMKLGGLIPGSVVYHIDDLFEFSDLLTKNGVVLNPLDFLIEGLKDSSDIHRLCENADVLLKKLRGVLRKKIVANHLGKKVKRNVVKIGSKNDEKALEDFDKIVDVYNSIKDFDPMSLSKTFSSYLIAYISTDSLYTYQKRAVMTGYLIRKSEYIASNKKRIVPKEDIQAILAELVSYDDKIIGVLRFLCNHDRIGIWDPVRPYFLFDDIVCMRIFNNIAGLVLEKAMDDNNNPHLHYEGADKLIEELTFGAVAEGYCIHVAEEFFN